MCNLSRTLGARGASKASGGCVGWVWLAHNGGAVVFDSKEGNNQSQLQSHRATLFVLRSRAHVAAEGQARVVRADNRESLVKVLPIHTQPVAFSLNSPIGSLCRLRLTMQIEKDSVHKSYYSNLVYYLPCHNIPNAKHRIHYVRPVGHAFCPGH